MAKPAVLYVSYDGMLEPLGQGQVIAYLERLSDMAEFHILSFEKPADRADAARREALAQRLRSAGIAWHPLTFRNRPRYLAAVWNLATGAIAAIVLALRHRIAIFHARNILCSLLVTPAVFLRNGQLISDMRAFWPDERADAGQIARSGLIYRLLKAGERFVLRRSARIVTLTEASKPLIERDPAFGHPSAPVSVIPTCADLDRFTPAGGPKPTPFTLGYLGSTGTTRMFGEVLACLRVLHEMRPDARLLVVSRDDPGPIRQKAEAAGIPGDAVEVIAADHAEVPELIRRMNAGTAINRPAFGELARAPTRLAEFLGCGVPCLANAGVGDMAAILAGEQAGVVLSEFSDAERRRAVERLLGLDADPQTPGRCRAIALEHFSLDAGVEAYRQVYAGLIDGLSARRAARAAP